MLGFKRAGVGFVLIKTDSIREQRVNITGENNKVLFTDVTYLPQQSTRVYGTVVCLPVAMGMNVLSMEHAGIPGYGAIRKYANDDMDNAHPAFYKIGGTTKYKFGYDIYPEVQEGDLIYFKWPVLNNKQNLMASTRTEPKEFLFKVPYDMIICVVRDGKIIPVGSHILVDPEVETFEEILSPTYYPTPGPNGEKVERPKKDWIMKKAFPQGKERQGTVKHVGRPLRGQVSELKPDMKVLLKLNLKNLYTIEGNKYIVIRQDKILAKIN